MQRPQDSDPGLPAQQADDVGDRIHVCVGADCNNNCVFCMEDDREDRRRRVQAQSRDDVRRLIEANRGVTEILFTSGEPTLNPDLPLYVRWAAEAGYRVVGVISNGRRYAHEPYLRHLLDAGANNFIVSIHGHDARTHDAVARTPGSFAQTFQGLQHLSRLRAHRAFRLQTATVVSRRNLGHLAELCALLRGLDADQHVFNVMMPDGRGHEHFDRLMPRYRDVTAAVAALVPSLHPEFLRRVALVDIPYCTTEGLPDSIRGYVERYFHYEPAGSFEERVAREGGQAPDAAQGRLFVPAAMPGERTPFTLVTRTFQESFVRARRAECDLCRHAGRCRGVWRPYVERFGWDEFRPVTSREPGGAAGQDGDRRS